MGIRSVELEIVSYRTGDISDASVALVYLFAKYSGIFGTKQWIKSLIDLQEIIQSQKPKSHTLNAEGLEIEFSGFPRPIPKIKEEGIVFESREPRFVVLDRLDGILPHQRTSIQRVSEAIAEEMNDVYHLKIERNPYTLIFPKEEYAKDIIVFEASLFENRPKGG